MNAWNCLPLRVFLGILAGSLAATSAARQPDDDEQHELNEIVVTGSMRVTAGGAQDVKFARREMIDGRVPHPDTITAEGLLGEHDLTLPSAASCDRLLCLVAEATRAELPTLPHARYLVGLGFASNLDAATWRRKPLNLVAVIDKSGSMSGEPLALVKRSLRGLVASLRAGDQLSIVLYGDRSHVHLPPTRASATNLERISRAVDAIESAGSTNMEVGLRVGYALARETLRGYEGITRVALFTDERPNVGRTDADSFIAMARAASADGIGLTTIGVGVQFDSGLATALSSTRGGNLFFLDGSAAADALFAEELDYMVSELAHDLVVTLRPSAGFKIAGVYGVPGEVLGWQDESSVTVTVPTLFLSRQGGGLFVSLAQEDPVVDLPERRRAAGSQLLAVTHSYLPLDASDAETGSVTVVAPGAAPSDALALGHALIDEYSSLRAATAAHHIENDQHRAYAIVRDLHDRLEAVEARALRRALAPEQKTVAALLEKVAYLSGRTSEVSRNYGSPLWGHWKVAAVDVELDYCPWDVDEVLLFTPTNEVVAFVPRNGAAYEEDYRQEYMLTRRQIYFDDEDLTAAYRVQDEVLTLRFGGAGELRLVRADAPPK